MIPIASRQNWSPYIWVVFTLSRSTIGIGNIWHFLYIVDDNGARTFFITYLDYYFIIWAFFMTLELEC